MKHVDRLAKLGHVHQPCDVVGVGHANLSDARTNSFMFLIIVRHQAQLHSVELVAELVLYVVGQVADVVECRTKPLDGLPLLKPLGRCL